MSRLTDGGRKQAGPVCVACHSHDTNKETEAWPRRRACVAAARGRHSGGPQLGTVHTTGCGLEAHLLERRLCVSSTPKESAQFANFFTGRAGCSIQASVEDPAHSCHRVYCASWFFVKWGLVGRPFSGGWVEVFFFFFLSPHFFLNLISCSASE